MYLASSLLGTAALLRYALHKMDPMTEIRKQVSANELAEGAIVYLTKHTDGRCRQLPKLEKSKSA